MTRISAPDETGGRPAHRGRVASLRARVRSWPGGRLIWRVGVTVLGVAVIVAGVILLPLPGPGWLIIFGGLGILATEYEWAARLLARVRAIVRRWTDWAARQPLWIRIALGVLGLVILAGIVIAAWLIPR